MRRLPIDVLRDWVRRLARDAMPWLQQAAERVSTAGVDRDFFLAFGAMSRRLGKERLQLTEAEIDEANRARHGWDPGRWTLDGAGRALLVLSLPERGADALTRDLDRLFADADLGEQVALYRALPILPHPSAHRPRCAEGIRTNMTDVFEAVALDNPYPAEQLDELAWNQLVLKAIFVSAPLHRVAGLDGRTNAKLARMLVDFARERRSAGRTVSPQLWRCVGPVASGDLVAALAEALGGEDTAERRAAALSVLGSPAEADLRHEHPAVFAQLDGEVPTWEDLWKGTP